LVTARHDGTVETLSDRGELCFQRPPVGELKQANTVAAGGQYEGPDRTFHPGDHQAIGPPALTRRSTEGPPERLPEAAVRLVTVAQRHVVEVRAMPNGFECFAHASSPAISLKGHAVVFEEIPPRSRRVDRPAAQVLVGE